MAAPTDQASSIAKRAEAAADRFGLGTSVGTDAAGSLRLEDDEESVATSCDAVEFVLGDALNAGLGTLQITTRRVVWLSQTQPGLAFVLRYPQIIMHAISRDTSAFPKPCIYLQLDDGSEDVHMGVNEGPAGEGDGEDVEEEEEDVEPEVRLVPEDAGKVEDLFKALCDCAAMNPDPEQDGEGEFFFDEGEVMAGLDPTTRAALMAQRLEGGMALEEGAEGEEAEELDELVGEDPSRFEDEDEEEEDDGMQAEGSGAGQGAKQHTANGH